MDFRPRNDGRQGPSTCQICGRWPSSPLCDTCLHTFAPAVARCLRCGARQTHSGNCPNCLPTASSVLRHRVAAVDYAYPWDHIIGRFKFQGESGWAASLAGLMLALPAFDMVAQRCDWVVPIPLSTERLVERGYNQAWELAAALCQRHPALKGKGLAQGLTRTGSRPDQHTLSRRQREQNLRDAFHVVPDMQARIARRRILLVDDVTTTGSTLVCAATALLAAGARDVSAAVIAHTP